VNGRPTFAQRGPASGNDKVELKSSATTTENAAVIFGMRAVHARLKPMK
jgi:hypothetical protein